MDPRDPKSELQSEQELDQDLERLHGAWPELSATEPPELVDQAVMNMARREVAVRPKRRPLRWVGAFATAAVVVLALTLVVQQDPRPPAPVLKQQDGFNLESPQKQEFKLDEAPRADTDAETEPMRASRLEKRAKTAADLPSPPAASPELLEASEMDAAVAGQTAAPQSADSGMAEEESMEFAAEPAAEIPPEAEAFSDVAEDIPDPAEWVEKLQLLHQSQLYEKLEQELAAFREVYPDYPLPPELQD